MMKPADGVRVEKDVACTRCGCVCDDLQLELVHGRVASFSPPCPLAEEWLLGGGWSKAAPAARICGVDAPFQSAVQGAAEMLHAAKAPLIYGLSESSTPGQRAAVRLADRIGAVIDTTASTCHAPSIMALQSVGESTSTLGETRNRSDVIIYWGSNPLLSHPRHFDRYVATAGQFTPRGRSDRHVVVIDRQATATSELADTFLQVDGGADFELAWAMRAALRGHPLPAAVAGIPAADILDLTARMKSCRHGTVFFGLGLTRHGVPHANVEALLRLVTDLNSYTRFVVRRMRVPGDVAGADTVLCWQTGFPFSVSLSRGYPRYNPGEYTANTLLERGEVDAVLLVGSEGVPKLSVAAQQRLRNLPTIVLDHPGRDAPFAPTIQFFTAVYGLHRTGTAYRMDEVPIPLRQLLDSPLAADHEILASIHQACSPV